MRVPHTVIFIMCLIGLSSCQISRINKPDSNSKPQSLIINKKVSALPTSGPKHKPCRPKSRSETSFMVKMRNDFKSVYIKEENIPTPDLRSKSVVIAGRSIDINLTESGFPFWINITDKSNIVQDMTHQIGDAVYYYKIPFTLKVEERNVNPNPKLKLNLTYPFWIEVDSAGDEMVENNMKGNDMIDPGVHIRFPFSMMISSMADINQHGTAGVRRSNVFLGTGTSVTAAFLFGALVVSVLIGDDYNKLSIESYLISPPPPEDPHVVLTWISKITRKFTAKLLRIVKKSRPVITMLQNVVESLTDSKRPLREMKNVTNNILEALRLVTLRSHSMTLQDAF